MTGHLSESEAREYWDETARQHGLLEAAPARAVWETQDLVVDGCIMAMQDFSVAELTALAEQAEKINADGWLPKMIREYLNVWRANG